MPGASNELAAGVGSEPWPSPANAWYAVAIFGLTVFTLFGNGFLVALMLEPIKHDMQFTDQQVAFIFGLAGQFTLAFASLVISPLADKYSRTLIIGIGLLILGCCNIGSAVVATAGALLVVRFIGGVGGAGNGPATFSLLADLFPPPKLPQAMATMNIGFMVAVGLSYLVGGYLLRSLATPEYTLPVFGAMRSWQVVFLIMAVPDLLLGVLILFTVHEAKRRGRVATTNQAHSDGVSYKEVFRYLWDNRRAFGPMYIGLGINCVALVGNSFWMAPFYQRTHGWGPGDFGVYQGWALLILAPAGLLFGGWLAGASRQARHHGCQSARGSLGISRAHSLCVDVFTGAKSVGGTGACDSQHLHHRHRDGTAKCRLPGHRAQQDARQDHGHFPVHVHHRQRAGPEPGEHRYAVRLR